MRLLSLYIDDHLNNDTPWLKRTMESDPNTFLRLDGTAFTPHLSSLLVLHDPTRFVGTHNTWNPQLD